MDGQGQSQTGEGKSSVLSDTEMSTREVCESSSTGAHRIWDLATIFNILVLLICNLAVLPFAAAYAADQSDDQKQTPANNTSDDDDNLLVVLPELLHL